MLRLIFFEALLCLLVVCVSSQRVPVGPYIQQILDIHNGYRRLQRSSNMQKLEWDDDLAIEAEDWARRCVFEHKIAGHGENLAFTTNNQGIDEQIRIVMEDMYNEKDYYYYNDQNNCGASCHYTQIVWANTTRVGCGMYVCGSLGTFSGSSYRHAWYLVCMYEPRANFCTPPCYPYLTGAACSRCNQGQVCDDGLCADRLSAPSSNAAGGQQPQNNNGQAADNRGQPNDRSNVAPSQTQRNGEQELTTTPRDTPGAPVANCYDYFGGSFCQFVVNSNQCLSYSQYCQWSCRLC